MPELNPYEKYVMDKHLKKGKLIDIDCNEGVEANYLAKKGLTVLGIDTQKSMIPIARKGKTKAKFELVDNYQKLPYKENSFDYVTMFTQMLEPLPSKRDRMNTIKEAARLVKPKGKVIISTHTRYNNVWDEIWMSFIDGLRYLQMGLLGPMYKGLRPGDRYSERRKTYTHFYTLWEIANEIEAAGLELNEVISSDEIDAKKEIPHRRKYSDYLIIVAHKAK